MAKIAEALVSSSLGLFFVLGGDYQQREPLSVQLHLFHTGLLITIPPYHSLICSYPGGHHGSQQSATHIYVHRRSFRYKLADVNIC